MTVENSEGPLQSAPPKPNSFRRMVGVFGAPVVTMLDIARRPDFLVALIVLIVISIGANIVAMPRLDVESEIRDQLTERGLTEEQIEKQLDMVTRINKVATPLTAIFVPLIILAIAGILLLAFKVFGGEGTFKQALGITTYSWFPLLLKGVITVALLLTRTSVTPSQMTTLLKSNLGFLASADDAPALFAFLSSLDVFVFWTLFLLIVGFAESSRFTRGKAAAMIISLWGIAVLARAGFAAVTG